MEVFLHLYLNKFITTVYVQLLLQANLTGLLEIQLLGDLFSNGRHLLQQLRVLLAVQLAASPPTITSTRAFGKYNFMKART
jgi:hypothetical protein